jgi:hypothetical protein
MPDLSKYKNKYLKMRQASKTGYVQPSPEQIEAWISVNFEYKEANKDQLRICNPSDGDDDFHMWISRDNAVVHDFRPGHQEYDGSFLRFVSLYKKISFADAVKEVCGSNVIIKQYVREDDEEEERLIELPKGSLLLESGEGKIRDICMRYLMNKRGFDEDVIFKYKIHYCGTNIVVPYYQYDMLVYYQSRAIMDKMFEFPDESQTKKKAGDFLWGFDDVEPCTEVIVVESIFNAMSIGVGAVATGGAKLKDGQLRQLKALNPKKVILAPDHDDAGINSLECDFGNLTKMAKGDLFKDIEYCIPPEKDVDWNDMLKAGENPLKYIRNNVKPLNMRVLFDGI